MRQTFLYSLPHRGRSGRCETDIAAQPSDSINKLAMTDCKGTCKQWSALLSGRRHRMQDVRQVHVNAPRRAMATERRRRMPPEYRPVRTFTTPWSCTCVSSSSLCIRTSFRGMPYDKHPEHSVGLGDYNSNSISENLSLQMVKCLLSCWFAIK